MGILGGTFNPIHLGHLLIAQDALEQAKLARVIFIPTALPPHKPLAGAVSAAHRLRMLRLSSLKANLRRSLFRMPVLITIVTEGRAGLCGNSGHTDLFLIIFLHLFQHCKVRFLSNVKDVKE